MSKRLVDTREKGVQERGDQGEAHMVGVGLGVFEGWCGAHAAVAKEARQNGRKRDQREPTIFL